MVSCLVAGLVLQQFATLLVTLIVGILLAIFIFYRFKDGKIHYLYFLFPIIIIASYFIMGFTSYMYSNPPVGNCTIKGMVYKVTETDYGYKLYVKDGFFDHKRLCQ